MHRVIFRASVRALDDHYHETAARLRELALREHGCLGFHASTRDGEEVAVSWWPDRGSIAAWKAHPEHVRAQRLGRERWYARCATEVLEASQAAPSTPRLVLQPPTPADADFLHELMNDPDYLRHIGDRGIRTAADARDYLLAGPVAHFRRHGFGLFRVALRSDGRPIGLCGLIQREYLPDVDLGFAFLPAWRRQGLAREAAASVMAHARELLGLRRLAAIVSPTNPASIGLLQRLGFRREGDMSIPGQSAPIDVYGCEP